MNKITKYAIAIILVLVIAYGGWLVLTVTFPLDVWFQENPKWRGIFNLLVIIGVIGFLAGLVETKRR